MLNVSKKDLFKDLDKAVEFDQRQIFKKLYENEFGTPGGEPYGALIGDYEFTNHPEDIELLSKMSNVAAAAFCPFVSAADPKLFGFDGGWTDLSKPRDLAKIFDSVEYAKWKSFRESEDSRFVTLTMPRVLARLPYGATTKPVEEFDYEEGEFDKSGHAKSMEHDNYCWMNAAYVMGTKLTDAFAKYGWCVAIRGAEGGGKVEGLPAHIFTSDDGDLDLKCPTEIGITDRREEELSDLGFLPLCHYKNTDYAVFFGAQTAQKPKKYDRPEATANAAICARLPYIMATFAHRPLPEGDGPRQDRLVHGGEGLRGVAEPLDLELRELEPGRGPGDEGQVSARGGEGDGGRDSRQARLVQRGRVPAPVVAVRGADHLAPHGGAHPEDRLTEQGQGARGQGQEEDRATHRLGSLSALAPDPSPLAPGVP